MAALSILITAETARAWDLREVLPGDDPDAFNVRYVDVQERDFRRWGRVVRVVAVVTEPLATGVGEDAYFVAKHAANRIGSEMARRYDRIRAVVIDVYEDREAAVRSPRPSPEMRAVWSRFNERGSAYCERYSGREEFGDEFHYRYAWTVTEQEAIVADLPKENEANGDYASWYAAGAGAALVVLLVVLTVVLARRRGEGRAAGH